MECFRGGSPFQSQNWLLAERLAETLWSCVRLQGLGYLYNKSSEWMSSAKITALIALFAMPIAFFFQVMGHTGTCTQGSTNAFMSGLIMSFPLIALSVRSLFASRRWILRYSRPRDPAIVGIFCIALFSISVWMINVNAEIAYYTLWLGITPCGPDHQSFMNELFEVTNLMVGMGYAIAPVIAAGAALMTLWSATVMHLKWSRRLNARLSARSNGQGMANSN